MNDPDVLVELFRQERHRYDAFTDRRTKVFARLAILDLRELFHHATAERNADAQQTHPVP